ncbi:MAG: thioredoxin-disulfide reductase [Desulfomonile sp.]|nr:thioredoxin-disulfide reductase [Desulfomonile sp.]
MPEDLIIVGGGPAGLTAGMYAARARLPVRLLEGGVSGGQLNNTAVVENYPGVESIAGYELASLMERQALKFGLEIDRERAVGLAATRGGFTVETESGRAYHGRAVILALGATPVKLGIPGETDYSGKGVSYCAVCDGPFFRDQEIAVIGGGDSAVEEAVYLTRFAKKVHIIHRRDEFRAAKEIQEKALQEPKIEVHWSYVPVAILGNDGTEALRIQSVKDGSEQDLPVAGVFFYVGLKPMLIDGVRELAKTDDRGFIITDESMACSTPGLFAAGDVRSKVLRQIATAVGDGAVAAFAAQHYLEGGRHTQLG